MHKQLFIGLDLSSPMAKYEKKNGKKERKKEKMVTNPDKYFIHMKNCLAYYVMASVAVTYILIMFTSTRT